MTNLEDIDGNPKLKDYRPQDIDLLMEEGIEEEWSELWEDSLHKETYIKDQNQMLWHLSRLSFLAGYQLATKRAMSNSE